MSSIDFQVYITTVNQINKPLTSKGELSCPRSNRMNGKSGSDPLFPCRGKGIDRAVSARPGDCSPDNIVIIGENYDLLGDV